VRSELVAPDSGSNSPNTTVVYNPKSAKKRSCSTIEPSAERTTGPPGTMTAKLSFGSPWNIRK
jgi:hypothetical protein